MQLSKQEFKKNLVEDSKDILKHCSNCRIVVYSWRLRKGLKERLCFLAEAILAEKGLPAKAP